MKNIIRMRLSALREAMKKNSMEAYLIPTGDFHNSEYVSDYFKAREYFSGFTGSNGTLVVFEHEAGLWTDGRYFIQAERELAGSDITLYRMGEEGVPTLYEYLADKLPQNAVLGACGRTLSTGTAKRLLSDLKKKNITLQGAYDLAEEIWQDRPKLPCGAVHIFDEKVCGSSIEERLLRVRGELQKKDAEGFFLSKLDDIMWLFGIRGCDVVYNPVALSFAYVDENRACLFLQAQAVSKEVKEELEAHGAAVLPYESIEGFLAKEIKQGTRVLLDEANVTYRFYELLSENCELIHASNPTEAFKAQKNETEQEHLRKTYLLDSVAVTRFIYWLKQNAGDEALTEMSAAEYLQKLRKEIPGYMEDSFETISAYEGNAAMMHYEPSDENPVKLYPRGFLLVDSGGQYEDGGTTDVTRTIALGELTSEMKQHYTWTAAGMLRLLNAKFLHGCTGRNLDILARNNLWEHGIDYKCGTGHGVGYTLNVHEGPQAIRWKQTENEPVLEEGMLITDEPGVYIEGSHGIRIENVLLCRKSEKTTDGQFMEFENLTFVPLEPEAMVKEEMTELEIKRYNDYQKMVYEKISPFLPEVEREWLAEETGTGCKKETPFPKYR